MWNLRGTKCRAQPDKNRFAVVVWVSPVAAKRASLYKNAIGSSGSVGVPIRRKGNRYLLVIDDTFSVFWVFSDDGLKGDYHIFNRVICPLEFYIQIKDAI